MSDPPNKFDQFRVLHHEKSAFVIPNPWDAGSARLLTSLGFQALATTSAGFAFSRGRRDSLTAFNREEILKNAAEIVSATHLPVSADLGNGFGAAPDVCAQTIRMASAVGLVGGSIEDASGDADKPIYELGAAVDRIRAAAEAAQGLPFLLTARAENYLWDRGDLDDTIKRLQAFSDAGADVLYAPGLPDIEAIKIVCSSVDKPVNVVMGLKGPTYSVAELTDAGVRRVSVGGSFARAAFGELMRAAQEVMTSGTFTYAEKALPGACIAQLMTDHELGERQ